MKRDLTGTERRRAKLQHERTTERIVSEQKRSGQRTDVDGARKQAKKLVEAAERIHKNRR